MGEVPALFAGVAEGMPTMSLSQCQKGARGERISGRGRATAEGRANSGSMVPEAKDLPSLGEMVRTEHR